jgi:hypothetical protein
MTTTSATIHEAPALTPFEAALENHPILEAIAAELKAGRALPHLTPKQIDDCCTELVETQSVFDEWAKHIDALEKAMIAVVKTQGAVPDKASQSTRLAGIHSVATITTAFTRTLKDEHIVTLRTWLDERSLTGLFPRMFGETKKYQLVGGVEDALMGVSMPERTREKIMQLFGMCISVKDKKPSLKVESIKPVKLPRKPRSKKAVA